MILTMTYIGIINLVSFGCLGIVCLVLLALNCKVRLERDQYKEEAEDCKSEVETYQAVIDEQNERIKESENATWDLVRFGFGEAHVHKSYYPPVVEVVARSKAYSYLVTIRKIYVQDMDDYQLAVNLAEELADKINEQV